MRTSRKIPVAMAAAFLFLGPAFIAWRSTAQQKIEESARVLFDIANQERNSRGIRPLKWDTSLADAARQHALRMAAENTLSHELPGEPDVANREKNAGATISAAAENIASGPSVTDIHTGWMNSPGHRRNLLNPQYDSVGIAVVQRGEVFWAVEDFSCSLAALSLEEQEKLVAKAVRAAGLMIRPDDSDARRVCDGRQPSESQPRFIAQFSSADLSALPAPLERTLRSKDYTQAEVGACTKPSTDGLSEYHIALLLY